MIRAVIVSAGIVFVALFSVLVGEMSRRFNEALEELY